VSLSRTVGSAVLVLLAASMAAAQEASAPGPWARIAGDDPALRALIGEGVHRNPDLLALEQAAAAARARPVQARALPDPSLSATLTNDGWAPSLGARDMTTLGVMLSQDLPWPGKRGLRGQIAALEADQVTQQLERGRLSVAAAVARAYQGLRQARLLLALARDQGGLWRQIEGVARARYAVGQGAQQDVLRTQIEVTRVGQLEAEQQAEEAVRLAELNRLLGRPAEAPMDTPLAAPLAAAGEPLPSALERLRAVSPELAAARLEVERARLAVELARKGFRPDFTVQAGYMNRGSLDPMWQAGVGLNLPFAHGRRQASLAEAEALRQVAERRVEAVDLQLRFRTQERLARLLAIERIAELYEGGILPQGRLSVEAAVASYQTGRVPFIAVLEALATLNSDRATSIRLRVTQAQARATLEEASLEASAEMAALPAAGMVAPSLNTRPLEEQTMRAGSGGGMGSGTSMKR